VHIVAETRRVLASLSNSLLNQVNLMVPVDCKSKSDSVIETMKVIVNERRRLEIIEKLKEGYEEMSQINLDFAEMGLEQDITDLVCYEANLKRRGML